MNAPQQAVLFVIKNDTTVLYGGGIPAVQGKTTWQGTFNKEQQIQYETLLKETHWAMKQPVRSANFEMGYYKIRFRSQEVDQTFNLPLRDISATTIYNFLQDVALVRLEKHIQALPKPNADVIIDRSKQQ
jgi:hypothetical protein